MRYPALLAGLGLIALTAAPVVAQPAPPQLAYVQPVPPQTVQAVQDKLRQAGAYNGRIDGLWGTDSQAALERFQQSNQLQVTGQLNQATMATLGLDPGSVMTAPVAAAPHLPRRRIASRRPRSARSRRGCGRWASITAPWMASGARAQQLRSRTSSVGADCSRMAS